MDAPFVGGYAITQRFGENPDRYARYHVRGHTGLDVLPSTQSRALAEYGRVLAVEGGIVVRLPFEAAAYGLYVSVLSPRNKRLWLYGHNSKVFVTVGLRVARGAWIANMGHTGEVWGAPGRAHDHLHIGLLPQPADYDNGYGGWIDPLSAMQHMERQDLERMALIAGANQFGIPLNDQAALCKYALAHRLGIPLTDEYVFVQNGIQYVGQVWSKAILYCPMNRWDDVQIAEPE